MAIHLFGGYGVEIEYMLVSEGTLNILPIADRLIEQIAGEPVADATCGELGISNELVLHVVELKTDDVPSSLTGVADKFAREVRHLNDTLKSMGARLMPSAAHPWMNPETETHLWPHESHEIYDAYNRIFDCHGHGWSNLQSVHLNLAFDGDDEFKRLHTAIRLLLPLIPALCSASPILDGKSYGLLDARMEFYRTNSLRIPSVSGQVVPEPVRSMAQYQSDILEKIYADIAPLDPRGIMQEEWLNARGAIARFERNAIEIRVIDAQESPSSDLAVCALISSAIKTLVEERWCRVEEQLLFDTEKLADLLWATTKDAHHTVITDTAYLQALGWNNATATAGDVWQHLRSSCLKSDVEWKVPLDTIMNRGVLAQRILDAVDGDYRHERLREVYGELCNCLQENRPLHV